MSTLAHVLRTYRCPICGGKVTAATAVYSRRTGNHYCADVALCARRAKRKGKTA